MKQRVNLRSPLFAQYESLPAEAEATNSYLYSSDFTQGIHSKARLDVSSNNGISPSLIQDADLLTSNTDTVISKLTGQSITSSIGTHTASVYLKYKGEGAVTARVYTNSTFSIWGEADFNLVDGTITSIVSGDIAMDHIGEGWYRVSLTGYVATSGTQVFRIYLQDTTMSGDGILLWGGQFESGKLSSYIPTTSSPVTRAATTEAQENEVTLSLKAWNGSGGYEYNRKNLYLRNKEFSNVVYGLTAAAVVEEDTIEAPDGSNDSDSLLSIDNSTTSKLISQNVTAEETGNHVFSIYVKANNSSEVRLSAFNSSPFAIMADSTFNLDDGTISSTSTGAASIQSLEDGWFRLSVTGLANSGAVATRVYISDSAQIREGVYLWGGQFELGSSPSSLIATEGSTVVSYPHEDDSPTSNVYTIVKDPINGIATFEIAELIRDYIAQNNDIYSGTSWVKLTLEDGLQFTRTRTLLATEGFIGSYEPIQSYTNAPSEEVLMQSNTKVIIPEGSSLKVPIYSQYNSHYTKTIGGVEGSLNYFSNSDDDKYQIDYINVDSSDEVLNFYVDSVLVNQINVENSQCSKYDTMSLMFLNKFGAKQEFFVNMKSVENIRIKDSGFNRNVIDYSTLSIDNGVHGYKRDVMESKESFTLNTPFLDEGNVQAFEELLLSEYVWLKKASSNYTPVTIKDNSMTRKTHVNDKLIQYTVNVESSFNLINNQR